MAVLTCVRLTWKLVSLQQVLTRLATVTTRNRCFCPSVFSPGVPTPSVTSSTRLLGATVTMGKNLLENCRTPRSNIIRLWPQCGLRQRGVCESECPCCGSGQYSYYTLSHQYVLLRKGLLFGVWMRSFEALQEWLAAVLDHSGECLYKSQYRKEML